MNIADHLTNEQRQKLNNIQSPKKKQKKQENLSRKDWEEIMGMRMDTFERRRGAVRRK